MTVGMVHFFFYKKQGGYIEKNSFTPFSYDLEANE